MDSSWNSTIIWKLRWKFTNFDFKRAQPYFHRLMISEENAVILKTSPDTKLFSIDLFRNFLQSLSRIPTWTSSLGFSRNSGRFIRFLLGFHLWSRWNHGVAIYGTPLRFPHRYPLEFFLGLMPRFIQKVCSAVFPDFLQNFCLRSHEDLIWRVSRNLGGTFWKNPEENPQRNLWKIRGRNPGRIFKGNLVRMS